MKTEKIANITIRHARRSLCRNGLIAESERLRTTANPQTLAATVNPNRVKAIGLANAIRELSADLQVAHLKNELRTAKKLSRKFSAIS